MCDRIFNRDTQQEIETTTELRALVGPDFYPPYVGNSEDDDTGLCLCNTDHEAILKAAGFAWEPVEGDTTDIITYRLQPAL